MARPIKYTSRTVRVNISIPQDLREKIQKYNINLSEFINNNMRFLLDENEDLLNDYKLEYESLIRERNALNSKIKDVKNKIEQLEAFKSKNLNLIEETLKKSDFKIFKSYLESLKENYFKVKKTHFLNFGREPSDDELYNVMSEVLNYKVLKLKELGLVINRRFLFDILLKNIKEI